MIFSQMIYVYVLLTLAEWGPQQTPPGPFSIEPLAAIML